MSKSSTANSSSNTSLFSCVGVLLPSWLRLLYILAVLAMLAVAVDACVRPPRPAQPRVDSSREQVPLRSGFQWSPIGVPEDERVREM